jgi:hypothetical protein
VPKDRHFSQTKSRSDRIDLVVIIDSIGHANGVGRVLRKLTGDNVPLPPVTQVYFNRKDVKTAREREHRLKLEVKARRAQKQQLKIKQCVAADLKAARQSTYYGHGCVIDGMANNPAPETTEETAPASGGAAKNKKRGRSASGAAAGMEEGPKKIE